MSREVVKWVYGLVCFGGSYQIARGTFVETEHSFRIYDMPENSTARGILAPSSVIFKKFPGEVSLLYDSREAAVAGAIEQEIERQRGWERLIDESRERVTRLSTTGEP